MFVAPPAHNDQPKPKVLITYAYYSPSTSLFQYFSSVSSPSKICRQNLDIFLSRGLVDSIDTVFIFAVIGDTQVPSSLLKAVSSMKNVHIQTLPNEFSDIYAHINILQQHEGQRFDYYITLNCEARGPYINTNARDNVKWVRSFTDKLVNTVGAVGPILSFKDSHYIESYAMAFTHDVKSIFVNHWLSFVNSTGSLPHPSSLLGNKLSDLEIILSESISNHGYHIIGFDNIKQSKYEDKRYSPECVSWNDKNSSNLCDRIDPCAVVFVKYVGDNNYTKHSRFMKLRIEELDRQDTSKMCKTPFKKHRPFWNVSNIFVELGDDCFPNFNRNADLVLIIRGHALYVKQMISMLYSIESSATEFFYNVSVLVLPTDEESFIPINDTISISWNNIKVIHLINVVVVNFPSRLFEAYTPYLSSLCTYDWKNEAVRSKLYNQHEVERVCDINSPLHYLLVDLALTFLRNNFDLKWLIITNADNFYTPLFFDRMKHVSVPTHIFMTDMISRGKRRVTSPRRKHVDLGAYAINATFLRGTDASFINSLPTHVDAGDYHDLDGIFVEFLHSKLNAVVTKAGARDGQFLFVHN